MRSICSFWTAFVWVSFICFASAAGEDRARLQQAFRRMRMDAVEVQTGADFVKPLAEVFRRREARRGR